MDLEEEDHNMSNDTKAFEITTTGTFFAGRTRLRAIIISSTVNTSGAIGSIRLTTPTDVNTTLFKTSVNAGQTVSLQFDEYPILFKDGLSVQTLSNCKATLVCDSLSEDVVTPLWSPGDFAQTAGWWDASDSSTFSIDGSNNVLTWNNKQNTSLWQMASDGGAATPVSGATKVNDLNVFDFTNPQRLAAGRQQAPWTKDGNLTVISFNVIGAVNQAADSIVSCADKNNAFWQVEADNASTFTGKLNQDQLGSADYQFLNPAGAGVPFSGNTILAQDLDHSTNTIRTKMNGSNVGSSTNYITQQGNTIDFTVMANSAGNRQLEGSFGELIVAHFANGFTGSQDYILKAEGYLAYKWGVQSVLPADHPYKVNPPREN
jgi:hypothetical protein